LVPHDFSEKAERGLSYALDLASRLGARVTIVHSYEDPYGYAESIAFSTEMLAAIERAAQKGLDEVLARAQHSGVAVRAVLRSGTPWREIDALASEMKADLIVMGTHGRGGIVRALLGSVAEKVVRTAGCPVITVRDPKKRHANADAAA
jgi:nucleotide-binding universal stress UspA family protein